MIIVRLCSNYIKLLRLFRLFELYIRHILYIHLNINVQNVTFLRLFIFYKIKIYVDFLLLFIKKFLYDVSITISFILDMDYKHTIQSN